MRSRRILRIARWEIDHQYSNVTWGQAGLFVAVLLVSLGLFTFFGAGSTVQDRIYVVGVESDSPYYDIVKSTPELDTKIVESQEFEESVQSDSVDVAITNGGKVVTRKDDISKNAANILVESVISSNRNRLTNSGYESIAYPILVDIEYRSQAIKPDNSLIGGLNQRENQTGGSSEDGQNENDKTRDEKERNRGDGNAQEEEPREENSDSVTDENTSSGDLFNLFGSNGDGGSKPSPPDSIQPPFPLDSIIIGFLFLAPLNFIVQAYASSVFDERIDYSGELLLVTPVSRYEIILGKTLPYLLLILLVATLFAFIFSSGIISILAIGVVGVAFLSLGFLTGVFARSYRELTFVFLTITLGLFGFILIPAVFTSIHPISIISPLTVVISQLEGEILTRSDMLFSMAPILTTGMIIYYYTSGIYEEEDLFSQKSVVGKFLDSLSKRIHSPKSLLLIGATLLPFVFVVQLLFIAILFTLPQQVAVPVILILAAFVEEIAKSVPVYAGVTSQRLSGRYEILMASGLSGLGFFLGEQVTTVAQLVGLLEVPVGDAVLSGTLFQVSFGTPLSFLVPVLWITIHPLTTMVDSLGITKSNRWYIFSLVIGTLIHLSYNLGVILYA